MSAAIVEGLEKYARTEERLALRARVAKLEEERDRYLMNGLEADRRCKELRARVAKLEAALQQSVELQSHYAELLNMHDGGQRLAFANVEAWLDRLATLKDKPK